MNFVSLLLEGVPRFKTGLTEGGALDYFRWVELFPGIRLWWHEISVSDEELSRISVDEENYYAIRWIEKRLKRLNGGYICELELQPDETNRYFENYDQEMDVDVDVSDLQALVSSFLLQLLIYNTQSRIVAQMNTTWTTIAGETEVSLNDNSVSISIESQVTNTDLINSDFLQIFGKDDVVDVNHWEIIRETMWLSGYTLLKEKSGRYRDFLLYYIQAMKTENLEDKLARFCTCLETILRPGQGNISQVMRSQIPLLIDSNHWRTYVLEEVKGEIDDQMDIYKSLIHDAWKARNKYVHGQSVNQKYWDMVYDSVQCFPSILYWVNIGIIDLTRIPLKDELMQAQNTGRLEWETHEIYDFDFDQIENDLYRFDCTHSAGNVEKYHHLNGKNIPNRWEYLDFLNSLDNQ